jgi:opacity protein-like surface antigen
MQKILIVILAATCLGAVPARAQTSRFRLNFGLGMGFNQGRTSNLAATSGNFVGGVGYNFSSRLAANLEYQYYSLDIKSTATDTEDSGIEDDVGQIDSISANVIVQPKNRLGLYGIGGVGWYRRFVRVTGLSLVPKSVADSAPGLNIGAGVTFPFGGRVKLYGEVRYHYARNSVIPTQVLPVTFGFHW